MKDSIFDLLLPETSLEELDYEVSAYIDSYNSGEKWQASLNASRLHDLREFSRKILAAPGLTISKEDFEMAERYHLVAQELEGWAEVAKNHLGRKSDIDAEQLKRYAEMTDAEIQQWSKCIRVSVERLDGQRKMHLYRFHVSHTLGVVSHPEDANSVYKGWLSVQVKDTALLISARTPSKLFITGFYTYLTNRRILELSNEELRMIEAFEDHEGLIQLFLGDLLPAVRDPFYFTQRVDTEAAAQIQPAEVAPAQTVAALPTDKDDPQLIESGMNEDHRRIVALTNQGLRPTQIHDREQRLETDYIHGVLHDVRHHSSRAHLVKPAQPRLKKSGRKSESKSKSK